MIMKTSMMPGTRGRMIETSRPCRCNKATRQSGRGCLQKASSAAFCWLVGAVWRLKLV